MEPQEVCFWFFSHCFFFFKSKTALRFPGWVLGDVANTCNRGEEEENKVDLRECSEFGTEFAVLMSVKHLEVQTSVQGSVKTRCIGIESFPYAINNILQYRKIVGSFL